MIGDTLLLNILLCAPSCRHFCFPLFWNRKHLKEVNRRNTLWIELWIARNQSFDGFKVFLWFLAVPSVVLAFRFSRSFFWFTFNVKFFIVTPSKEFYVPSMGSVVRVLGMVWYNSCAVKWRIVCCAVLYIFTGEIIRKLHMVNYTA